MISGVCFARSKARSKGNGHSDLEFGLKTGAVLLILERDLFQTQILHLLHQVLMVKLNNNLKGIVRPRQNVGG
jgi:hypothetical protein